MISLLALAIAAGSIFDDPTVVELPVCSTVSLPGKQYTLNPYDPPEKWIQQTARVCETLKIPDPQHILTPYDPVRDYAHDRRAIA